ncbi:MAG: 50S ribosomal protein L11 methyltransferase [Eubacteriales bacterium]|nr:50S ribosomal protein L11 methyltransferase [Eubacteriales bacterium]
MISATKTIALDFQLPHEAAEIFSEFLLASGAAGLASEDRQEFASLITAETPDYQAEDYLNELPDEVSLRAFFRGERSQQNGEQNFYLAVYKEVNFGYELYADAPMEVLELSDFLEQRLGPQLDLIKENLNYEIQYLGASEVEEVDWAERWKEFFQALEIGEHLYIRPAWREDPLPPGRSLVLLEPGAAFGSGTHATTELCLASIEREFAKVKDADLKVLDLGCGSGILGIALACLTPIRPELIDLDPYAIERAKANAALNKLDLDIRQGELSAAKEEQYDYLIANLITRLHQSLAKDYASKVKAGGKLLLSGILERDRAELIEIIEAAGFKLLESKNKADWCALTFLRS